MIVCSNLEPSASPLIASQRSWRSDAFKVRMSDRLHHHFFEMLSTLSRASCLILASG